MRPGVRPVPLNASNRVQSITPRPQVRRTSQFRPMSSSPPPFELSGQSRLSRFEDIFGSVTQSGSHPANIALLARGVSLLSITQLRDLLRDFSLPTGGNKHLLVNRLIIYLETFGQNQQNLLAQFSAKLKRLLSVETEDARDAIEQVARTLDAEAHVIGVVARRDARLPQSAVVESQVVAHAEYEEILIAVLEHRAGLLIELCAERRRNPRHIDIVDVHKVEAVAEAHPPRPAVAP